MKDLDALEMELRKQLLITERNIYITEGRYIKETANFGNVFKGWDAQAKLMQSGSVPSNAAYQS